MKSPQYGIYQLSCFGGVVSLGYWRNAATEKEAMDLCAGSPNRGYIDLSNGKICLGLNFVIGD